ncbi:hypothetical protein [Xanthomarina gelatinilytica]|uniref:hypothetical protein n=1 Tax=Xanthomarina gelatinilytica TaxID=1137281 RepID=UPI003AA7DD2B
MKKPYFFLLFVLTLLNCSNDNSKINYLNDFAVFIDELEFQKTSEYEINWEEKNDSLNMFINRKDKFRLSAKDEQSIALLINKYNNLKGVNSNSEMKVNFYFENSLSMNGYLGGDNFLETMTRLLGKKRKEILNTFFVNTKIHETGNLLNKIETGKIDIGNVYSSDHQMIFKTAIENAENNNLSIVVTDGIYSVEGKKPNIVAVKIEQTFVESLKENSIETLVLKMSSNYRGTYYTESECDNVKNLNQKRPYYILLFGNRELIDKALNEIAIIDELPGFKEQARFFLTDNLKANYTILTTGEEKHGQFKASKKGSDLIEEIEDVEKYERPGFNGTPKSENYLQFGIAIDYSTIALPNTYKEDSKNYWADDQLGYTVTSISNVADMDKSSKTFKEVQHINDKNKTNFTHVITVKAEKNLYGNLNIQLKNNLPSWIKNTGTDNDCDIIDDVSHTFAFDQLMIGISKAYQKVTDKSQYLDINLKIKP